ncbi:type IV pilus biogenesis/stability protein PilW [Gammaproteobacteria bacterium 50_400_T64]|nr:type IV pilus biogenesis/stability protein PilW [Gammaproteobacteria bacterium 50_400_T64]
MPRQLITALSLAIVMILSAACTVTEMDYSKSIGTSSASEASANRHDGSRDKKKEAAETYVQLGLGYLRKGDRTRARTNLLKALEKDDSSGAAHNAMALLLQLEDEAELAEEHFEKAMLHEPEMTRYRYNYSVFLLRQNRYEDAYEQFTIAAEDINYGRRARVFYSLGLISSHLSKPDEAKKSWEKAVKLNPQLAGPFLELADLYFKMGDYPKAKRYLGQYEKLSKPAPRALWLAVRLEYAFGNKDGEASKAMALKNMFPYSEQALEYKAWLKSREDGVQSLFPTAKDTLDKKDSLKIQ